MPPPPRKSSGAGRGRAPQAKRAPNGGADGWAGETRARRDAHPAYGIPSEERTMATRKALVIGINDYGGAPNNLTSCVNDADAITHLLQSSFGFGDVHTLRDSDVTIAHVESELEWLAKSAKADDRLVFYFSGLGYTRFANGDVEECLAVRDGLFESDRLVSKVNDVAPGTLTTILDVCFSGGTEQFILDPTGAAPELEVAQVKAWKPTAKEVGRESREARDKGLAASDQHRIAQFKRFACAPVTSRAGIAKLFATAGARSRAPHTMAGAALGAYRAAERSAAGEMGGELELNGLLISACLETETAAASTSHTEGLSAFTHALTRSVERVGPTASTADVLAATEGFLKSLGFQQTPRVLERAVPGDLVLRHFITIERAPVTDAFRFMSEPRFWEGAITALAPQLNAARAVNREGELMTSMYQPMQGGYQPMFNAYQPAFGTTQSTTQASIEDAQRLAPILGPVLASVIPTLVPTIVNAILTQQLNQQRAGLGASAAFAPSAVPGAAFVPGISPSAFGVATSQPTTEDIQRALPYLAPILASVIPAIVPQIVNGVLAQQRTSHQWSAPVGSQDLWNTISQSVNDSLQRIGLPTTPLAGRPFQPV